MKRAQIRTAGILVLWAGILSAQAERQEEAVLSYVRMETREATRQASIDATREQLGKVQLHSWMRLTSGEPLFLPEGGVDLDAASWQKVQLGEGAWTEVNAGWLYRIIEVEAAQTLSLRVGTRERVNIQLNGGPLNSQLGPPGWLADQMPNLNEPVLLEGQVRPGENHLTLAFSRPSGFYFEALPLPESFLNDLDTRLAADFPPVGEERYYRIETIEVPKAIVLEVGGMDFTPDGRLMICTRRGEIWSYFQKDWELFASGLHEPLGLWAGQTGEVFVVQRSELTRVVDTNGDGRANRFETITAECGVSDSGHAFIFGPVRDRAGNFWGAISYMGGHSGTHYGWSFKVTPEGEFIPWSSGLRSPNGIGITPDDEIFVTDNQGDWVGTSPLHHLSKGAFHGHPGGLRWDANFKGDRSNPDDLDRHRKPAAVLFPYGSMGQSISEPRVDTTAGRFGPFAGHMFVGDQTKSILMRVTLEKVGGEYQGACYPFRSGFQSGINRIVFAPDGSLYVGQTDRGWGSIGGRSYGLQRVIWTGRVPFEIHTMRLARDGFELEFTRPVNAATAMPPSSYSLQHYYYPNRPQYGSPPMGHTAVPVQDVTISPDGKVVRLTTAGLVPGRIYELNLRGVRSADGREPSHTVAYYTLNRLLTE